MIKYIILPIFKFIVFIVCAITIYLIMYPFGALFSFLYDFNFKKPFKMFNEMRYSDEYKTIWDWYLNKKS
jgi:hypothetical protein